MLLRHCCRFWQQCCRFRQQCRTKFSSSDNVEPNWTCLICFDFVERKKFYNRIVRHCCRLWQQSRTLLRYCCWYGRGFTYQTKKNLGCLSNCRYCADRAQNLPGLVPNVWLTLFQTSSKSVHIRRSYSRTREDRFLPYWVFTRYRLSKLGAYNKYLVFKNEKSRAYIVLAHRLWAVGRY